MNPRGVLATVAASPAGSTAGTLAEEGRPTQAGAYAIAVRETWRPAEIAAGAPWGAHREVVRYATLAPSSLNTQPWKFRVRSGELFVHPDFTRRMLLADPDDERLFMALGCAAENASIAARAFGMNGTVAYHPSGLGGLRVELAAAAHIEPSALFHAIPRRQSGRGLYDGRMPSEREVDLLERSGADLGVHIAVVSTRYQIERIAELACAAYAVQRADSALLEERKKWIRFSEREALRRRDGVFARCEGRQVLPQWLGERLFALSSGRYAYGARYAQQMRSSGGFAALFGGRSDPRSWTAVGRACERFLLQATALNMRAAMVLEPLEVRAMRLELGALLHSRHQLPDALIRFGYGPPGTRSLRRSHEEVTL